MVITKKLINKKPVFEHLWSILLEGPRLGTVGASNG